MRSIPPTTQILMQGRKSGREAGCERIFNAILLEALMEDLGELFPSVFCSILNHNSQAVLEFLDFSTFIIHLSSIKVWKNFLAGPMVDAELLGVAEVEQTLVVLTAEFEFMLTHGDTRNSDRTLWIKNSELLCTPPPPLPNTPSLPTFAGLISVPQPCLLMLV